MVDLEDSILRTNVPGRYSSWRGEDDDVRRGGEKDDGDDVSDDGIDHDDEYYFRDLPSHHTPHPPPPHNLSGGDGRRNNTGVKGVLADYRDAMIEEQRIMEEESMSRLAMEGGYARRRRAARSAGCSRVRDGGGGEDDGGDDDHSEDDDNEERRGSRPPGMGCHQGGGVRGRMLRATPDEYVDYVDANREDDDHRHLVVCLYDPDDASCSHISYSSAGRGGTRRTSPRSALDELAYEDSGMGATFIEVDATMADPDLDTICLPALLIYRRGVLVHNLVRFVDDLPHDYVNDDLRAYLEGLGVFLGGGGVAASGNGCRNDDGYRRTTTRS